MSPTRRGFLTGTAALLAGGHLAPAAAAAIKDADAIDDGYLSSPEHLAWQAIEDERERDPRWRRGVKEATFRMEVAIDVHDPNGLMLGCVPVERTGHVKLFADGSGRIALWGPDVWKNGSFGDLTPATHFVETCIDAEAFAPIAAALFATVNMERAPVCNSAVASDWMRRRHSRVW
jgi:hypothetical protein